MAINRYVDVNFDQPVSNYVPLPLEMLYKLGKDASKDYEDTMKDMESGKDPISKLNTRSVARVYDPAQGGMVDAPIDFEKEKKGVLDYMNTQKQQIVDDYIKDKDTNRYKQRAAKLKGELTSAYSDLAGKSAIVDQINKENIELSKSEAFGLNPAYATKRLQYNTQYLKDMQNPDKGLQAYAPPAVAKQVSMEDVYVKDITGWKEDDMGSKSYTDGQYIHDINTKGITGTRVYDYAKRAWNDPNHSARAVANLELEHDLNMKGLKPDSIVEYQDYKKDADGNIIKDKQGNPVLEVKKGKYADIFMEDKQRDYAQALADRIVHQTIDTKMSADAFGLHDYKQKVAEESAKSYANTSSVGNPTATNMQQLLSENGLSDLIDADGNIKSHNSGILVGHNPAGMLPNIGFYGATEGDNAVNAAFKKAQEVGKALNLPTPKDGNWVKAVHRHFQNVAIQASTTSDFHPSTAESLTKNFLGENSDIGNMEIYPQGSQNKNDKATTEVAGRLAKNSKFTGIDYYANDNAGLKLAYTPKDSNGAQSGPDESYIAIPKNKNFLAEAEPVRHISNAYVTYMKNPVAYDKDIKENPNKYFKTDDGSTNILKNKAKEVIGEGSKLIATSVEIRKDAKNNPYTIYRGVVEAGGNTAVLTYNGKTKTWNRAEPLQSVQEEQTHYIETEGSLRQFNTKLAETLKTTEVE